MAKPYFSQLPEDLLDEIMSKVGKDSAIDFVHAGATCKNLANVSKKPQHLRNLNLRTSLPDRVPILDAERSFVEACRRAGNSEAQFRIGMEHLFRRFNVNAASYCFWNAYFHGHQESMYINSMFMLCRSSSHLPDVQNYVVQWMVPRISQASHAEYINLRSLRERVFKMMDSGVVNLEVALAFQPPKLESCFCNNCCVDFFCCRYLASIVEALRNFPLGEELMTLLCPSCKCYTKAYYFGMELTDRAVT